MGIAAYGNDEPVGERDALRAADAARYEAKRRGRWMMASTGEDRHPIDMAVLAAWDQAGAQRRIPVWPSE